jgi:hypothetical protein
LDFDRCAYAVLQPSAQLRGSEHWDAQLREPGASHPLGSVEAGEFGLGGIQADLEFLDLAKPAVHARLGDALGQICG